MLFLLSLVTRGHYRDRQMTIQALPDWRHDGWTTDDLASIQFLAIELLAISTELAKGVDAGVLLTPQDLCVLARLVSTISSRLTDIGSGYA